MSTPNTYTLTKIFAIGDVNPEALVVDGRYRHSTITVQPLNLTGTPDLLDVKTLLVEDNAATTGVSGTVTIECTPPNTFQKYPLGDENVIDLAVLSFINTDTPITKIHPTFTNLAGCTHIAVSVNSFMN